MHKVFILPAAKQDIKDAADWYNKRQKGLGKRFTKEVREKVKSISENPLAIPVRYDEIRTAVLHTFPFMIHFSLDEKMIIILGVYHTSRSPSIWKDSPV